MSLNKKAQASVEFILVLSIMLVIFLSFLSIVQDKNAQFHRKTDSLEAKTIAEKTGMAVNEVHLAGENSSWQLFLPDKINSKNYSIEILNDSRLVRVSNDNIHYTFPLITSKIVNGELEKGQVNMKNEAGVIVFE